jgi:hypothetical protein
MCRASGENATAVTWSAWPSKRAASRPLATSHKRTVLSEEAETMCRPSGEKATARISAGALGSKVASHLVRSGSVALKIVDYAKMSPHNLVRHALGGGAIGLSKAEALKAELLKIFPGQPDLPIEARDRSILEVYDLRNQRKWPGHTPCQR